MSTLYITLEAMETYFMFEVMGKKWRRLGGV